MVSTPLQIEAWREGVILSTVIVASTFEEIRINRNGMKAYLNHTSEDMHFIKRDLGLTYGNAYN